MRFIALQGQKPYYMQEEYTHAITDSSAFAPVGRHCVAWALIPRVPFRFAPFCPGLMAGCPSGARERHTRDMELCRLFGAFMSLQNPEDPKKVWIVYVIMCGRCT